MPDFVERPPNGATCTADLLQWLQQHRPRVLSSSERH
jgi:hypothetical protein